MAITTSSIATTTPATISAVLTSSMRNGSEWKRPPSAVAAPVIVPRTAPEPRPVSASRCERRAPGTGTRWLMGTNGPSGEQPSRFDRFVEAAHAQVSRAPFFLLCVAVILGWLVSYPLFADPKAWQVVIHTITSVTTLLLVALLENAGRRDARAAQEKLSTLAGALADLMDSRGADDPQLKERAAELREAVGIEERTST